MRRSALLLCCLCALGSAKDIHMRVVVDANSPADYNRWLWQHRTECPEFRPVYITHDSSVRRNDYLRPAVSFWTDSGPLLQHRVMPDSIASFQQLVNYSISPAHDLLATRGDNGVTSTYDRFGRKLFSGPEGVGAGVNGRWLRYSPTRRREEVLNDSGEIVGTLPFKFPVDLLYADDSFFVVRTPRSSLVLVDREARVRWQSRELGRLQGTTVADRCYAIAAAAADSLVIYDRARGSTVTVHHDSAWSRYGWPLLAWSHGARLLALYQGSRTSQDSGRVMVMDRRGMTVRPSRSLRAHWVRAVLWLGDTLVLPGQDVDTAGADTRMLGRILTDSCLLTFVLPGGEQRHLAVRGKFWPYGDWRASSPYLAYLLPPRRFMVAELVR